MSRRVRLFILPTSSPLEMAQRDRRVMSAYLAEMANVVAATGIHTGNHVAPPSPPLLLLLFLLFSPIAAVERGGAGPTAGRLTSARIGVTKTAPGWSSAVRQQFIEAFETAAARYGEGVEEYEELKRKCRVLEKATRALKDLAPNAVECSGGGGDVTAENKGKADQTTASTARAEEVAPSTAHEGAKARAANGLAAAAADTGGLDARGGDDLQVICVRGHVASDGAVAARCLEVLATHLEQKSAAILRVRMNLLRRPIPPSAATVSAVATVPTASAATATVPTASAATVAAVTAVPTAATGSAGTTTSTAASAVAAETTAAVQTQLRVLIVSDEGAPIETQRRRVAALAATLPPATTTYCLLLLPRVEPPTHYSHLPSFADVHVEVVFYERDPLRLVMPPQTTLAFIGLLRALVERP